MLPALYSLCVYIYFESIHIAPGYVQNYYFFKYLHIFLNVNVGFYIYFIEQQCQMALILKIKILNIINIHDYIMTQIGVLSLAVSFKQHSYKDFDVHNQHIFHLKVSRDLSLAL